MTRYIFAYHGGSTPETEDEQQRTMALWMSWIEAHQAAWVDSGAPVGQSTTVTAASVENNGGSNQLTGYAFVTAESMEAAVEIAKGCPILLDGGSVEIASVHEMS